MRVSRTDLDCGPAQREDRAAPALRGRLAGLFRNRNTGSVTIPWSGFQPDHDGALARHEGRQVGVATSARGGSIVFGAHDPDLLQRLDAGGSVVVEIDGTRVDLASLLGAAPVRSDALDLDAVRRDVRAAMADVEPIDYGRHAEPLRGRSEDDDGAREDGADAGSVPLGTWPHGGDESDFAPLERLAGDARPIAPVPSGLSRSDYGLPEGGGVQIKAASLRERLGADRSRAEEIMRGRRGR